MYHIYDRSLLPRTSNDCIFTVGQENRWDWVTRRHKLEPFSACTVSHQAVDVPRWASSSWDQSCLIIPACWAKFISYVGHDMEKPGRYCQNRFMRESGSLGAPHCIVQVFPTDLKTWCMYLFLNSEDSVLFWKQQQESASRRKDDELYQTSWIQQERTRKPGPGA